MIKYLVYILLSFLLVLFEYSVLSTFNIFNNLNLILVVLVFLTIIFGFNLSLFFAVFVGLFLSIYSYLPFGSLILIYLIVILVVNFLYKNVLINLSFFSSVLLVIIASVLYAFVFILFNFLFFMFGLVDLYIVIDNQLFVNLGWQLVANVVLMSFIFIIAKISIKKLNLALLIRK